MRCSTIGLLGAALLCACESGAGGGGVTDDGGTASDTAAPDIGAVADDGAVPDAGVDAEQDAGPVPDPSEAIFALDVLHEIAIEIDPALFPQLDADHETRVPANFTYDGVTLQNVGIREKCGIGSCTTIADKAAFSVKFDTFVAGQELAGLERLALNNSIQDPSYSNELLGQEISKRAGLPYSRVAYANVTLNGEPYGLFEVVESVDKRFLRRHFGEGQDEGNLYEGPCCADFVSYPWYPELKREAEEGRSREDLNVLADFIANTDDDAFMAGIGDRVDWTGYLTGYAISALTFHWDGYEYNTNNFYMYHRPSDDRFVFWLHGMDQLFYDCGWSIHAMGPGRLGQRVQQIAGARDAFRDEVARVLDEVWRGTELLDFLDAARAVYQDAARADPRHPLDEGRLRGVRYCLIDRPDWVGAQLAAVCGNGLLEPAEQCDDGNEESHDGCSQTCLSECGNGMIEGAEQCDDGNRNDWDGCSAACTVEPGCGDGIEQPEFLEDCDDGANGDSFSDGCRDDCTANACRDGRLDAGEECDDGNSTDGDGCSFGCADEDGSISCGNGILELGEQCDDGDLADDDACTSSCVRPCWGADAATVWGANQHCYLLLWSAGLDWSSAEADCEARGGHLATVGRESEQRLLRGIAGGGWYWLGLSDQAVEGSFEWITGEPNTFTAWHGGQPDNAGGNENCGGLLGPLWNDFDCATLLARMCELE